jgi:hypothetical protein
MAAAEIRAYVHGFTELVKTYMGMQVPLSNKFLQFFINKFAFGDKY